MMERISESEFLSRIQIIKPEMIILTPHQSRALNIDKSISLTANAGSGKTFVLSQRFLEIIIKTQTPLSQVAAITFTDRAAGELYKRISDELNKLLLNELTEETRNRVEKIRKQLVSAKISTIHSFCIDLLKEFPVESSIDANFTPIDGQKASELTELAIEDTLREMMKDPVQQSDVKLLIRLFGSRAIFISQLAELIDKRKIIFQLIDRFYSDDENKTRQLLSEVFSSNINLVFSKNLPYLVDQLNIINNKVLKNKSDNETAVEIEYLLKGLEQIIDAETILKELKKIRRKILTKDGSVRKQGYITSTVRDEAANSIRIVEEFFADLDEIEFPENRKSVEEELIKHSFALVRVFLNVLTAYDRKKSDLGVLDFEDILIKTKSILQNETVRKLLSDKYKYLLIDEYQDTNEIQYEIFLPLVDDLKRGNLFVVGDEKQSIYRFRDAELQVFSKTKTDIRRIHGNDSLLTLPDSFRMTPAICFFVNSLFKNLFSNPIALFNEVAASELVCARTDDFKGNVEFLIADGENETEAELVAKRIIQLKNEHAERFNKWSDIAVLVRKRTAFIDLQKALIKYGIPFNLVGGTGFYQKQSISDIYNYFAFLLNDKNDAALIGILRSPFFMVSDTKIMQLSLFDGDSYWEKLELASKSEFEQWGEIFAKLQECKTIAHRVNVPKLLRKILSESDFISVVSSRIDGQQENSNINKLISLTNEFFNNEFNTLYDYVSFLNDAIRETEDEAQGKIEAGREGVNISTIHQSKGLEYPAVFLYKCNDTTPTNKVKARSFSVDKEFGLLTKVPMNEDYFDEYQSAPVVGLYNLIEAKKDMAELKRLLYVATTRAKDLLFISLTDDGKAFKKNSFSALIEEGLRRKLSGEKLVISGQLSHLEKNSGSYSNLTKPFKLEIPITRKIELTDKPVRPDSGSSNTKKITIRKIEDHSKGEIISATRFSTFSSCQMKYNLQYNYKLGELIEHSRGFSNIPDSFPDEDYNRNELNSYLLDDESRYYEYAKYRGKLIHYLFRKNVSLERFESFLDKELKKYFRNEVPAVIRNEIIDELSSFYNSELFRYINSFKSTKNEYEVYLKKEDYYLFGIIDKLLISDEKMIIIDYKTDFIKKSDIESKAEAYLPQLQFYAYIISRLFNKNYKIEGIIIFTRFPENPFKFNYNDAMDNQVEKILIEMISAVRGNNYSKNLNACKTCGFSDKNFQCIMQL